MRRIIERAVPCLIVLLIGVLGPGCAGTRDSLGGISPREVPLTDMNDPEAPPLRRKAAVEHARLLLVEGEGNTGEVRETLKWAVWKRKTTQPGVRLAAAEALLEDEANIEDTHRMFVLLIPTERDVRMIGLAADEAVARGWTDMAPSLVRSWSRAPQESQIDPRRPERSALEALYPGMSAEEVVYRVFSGELGGDEIEDKHREAAWALLRSLDPTGARTAELLELTSGGSEDDLASVLQLGVRDLGIVAGTTEELRWLRRLSEDRKGKTWERAKAAVAQLDANQREGLALRHVPGLMFASEHRSELLGMSRQELMSVAASRLEGQRRYERVQSAVALGGGRESLEDWREELVWGDSLMLVIATKAFDSTSMLREVFEAADRDKLDVSTEYGGIIGWDTEGDFTFALFPPRPTQRFGDNRFVASDDMIDQSTTALFHFHMQVQSHDNRRYAGPSGTDIIYAREYGRACLVFTFVNKSTLNVDYYQPNRAAIDCGVLIRPGSRG